MLENRPALQNGLEKAGVIAGVAVADPGARIRCYLHKEFRAAEIGFYLLVRKEFRAAGGSDVDENGDCH